MRVWVCLVLIVGAFAAPAHAADTAYDSCMNKAVSTRDMQECQKAALAAIDVRLNAAYRKAMAALPADQQEKLRTSERLWIGFREADCQTFYGKETGTMATIQGGACMMDRAEQRILNLAEFSQN